MASTCTELASRDVAGSEARRRADSCASEAPSERPKKRSRRGLPASSRSSHAPSSSNPASPSSPSPSAPPHGRDSSPSAAAVAAAAAPAATPTAAPQPHPPPASASVSSALRREDSASSTLRRDESAPSAVGASDRIESPPHPSAPSSNRTSVKSSARPVLDCCCSSRPLSSCAAPLPPPRPHAGGAGFGRPQMASWWRRMPWCTR
mmetsp:Transcript_29460/g.97003  ORF Transcript_29460/g.97003 Transcript_29460/m.97003 type:complete len:206 (+) Transcript_29460:1800-2417(+)